MNVSSSGDGEYKGVGLIIGGFHAVVKELPHANPLNRILPYTHIHVGPMRSLDF